MARKRLTNRAAQNNPKKAAQPPASYDWTPEHPAYKADANADQYLIDNDGNGTGSEPSDFNEDVHEGPYENSAHPAMPGEEEEGHPAAKSASQRRKEAYMVRKAAEKKAAKCIRIAQALLGKGATVEAIENQAVDLMDLPDAQVDATLDRLSATFLADQNDPAGDTLAPAGEPVIQACGDEMTAGAFYAEEDDAEALLAQMLEEEANVDVMDEEAEVEALLAEMLMEGDEAPAVPTEIVADMLEEEAILATENTATENVVTEPVQEEVTTATEEVTAMDGELGLEMLADDPMGLTADENEMDDLLAELYGGKFAAKKAEDEEASDEEANEEEANEEEASDEKESSKKASTKQSPKPRKASNGAKSLGTVTKTAANELNELAALWETAPDVSGFFDQ